MHRSVLCPIALLICSTTLGAQMPGAPVLQNAWAAPGIVAAIDYGGGSGGAGVGAAASSAPAPVLQNAWAAPGIVAAIDYGGGSGGSVYAAAASWAPASARFQLSGGAGLRSETGSGSKSVYGLRAAVPFGGGSSNIGFGVFAG